MGLPVVVVEIGNARDETSNAPRGGLRHAMKTDHLRKKGQDLPRVAPPAADSDHRAADSVADPVEDLAVAPVDLAG